MVAWAVAVALVGAVAGWFVGGSQQEHWREAQLNRVVMTGQRSYEEPGRAMPTLIGLAIGVFLGALGSYVGQGAHAADRRAKRELDGENQAWFAEVDAYAREVEDALSSSGEATLSVSPDRIRHARVAVRRGRLVWGSDDHTTVRRPTRG